MNTFYDERQPVLSTNNIVAIGVSALVLFGVVYLAGRAWKSSQKA